MPSQAQAHIYDILTTHDIPITREDISWAFSSSKTAVEIDEYAEKYLGPECFLSLEEAEIYEHIKETHLLKLHKSRDLAAVNPHTEEYLRLEIERLKASTESHRKHTEILKRQKIVLDGLKKQEKQVDDNRKRLRERRRKKWVGEREKVVIEIENLIIALRNQIKDLQHDDSQSTAPNTTASNLVDLNSLQEMLASDDKILKKLERLAEETDVGDIDGSKEQKVVDKVRLMTQKLSDLLTAVVRTRLDRVYSETLGCPKEWTFVKSEEENQVIYNLQKDLEGLDLEIPAVSKMSTEGEFLRPVLGEVKKRKALLEDIVGGRGSYVSFTFITLKSCILIPLEGM
ncbi:hypothetical protein DFH27DRAFT_532237 [Peziza echinospora]|nr:hypothetical protein DFH27DRAFT_532237 [Peziza echinospora]